MELFACPFENFDLRRPLREAIVKGQNLKITTQDEFLRAIELLADLWPEHPLVHQVVLWATSHHQPFGVYEWIHDHVRTESVRILMHGRMFLIARRPAELVMNGLGRDRLPRECGALVRELEALHESVQGARCVGWEKAAGIALDHNALDVYRACVRIIITRDPFRGYVLASQPAGSEELVDVAKDAILLKMSPRDATAQDWTDCLDSHRIHDVWPVDMEPFKRFVVEQVRAARVVTGKRYEGQPQKLCWLLRYADQVDDEQIIARGCARTYLCSRIPKDDPVRERLGRIIVNGLANGPTAYVVPETRLRGDALAFTQQYWWRWDLLFVIRDAGFSTTLRARAADIFVRFPPLTQGVDYPYRDELQAIIRDFPDTQTAARAQERFDAVPTSRNPLDLLLAQTRAAVEAGSLPRFLADLAGRRISAEEAEALWTYGSFYGVRELNRAIVEGLHPLLAS